MDVSLAALLWLSYQNVNSPGLQVSEDARQGSGLELWPVRPWVGQRSMKITALEMTLGCGFTCSESADLGQLKRTSFASVSLFTNKIGGKEASFTGLL